MALKTTVADMRELMHEIMQNLEKSERGNRSAAQRARLCSIRFEKAAKRFRKESIAEAKSHHTNRPSSTTRRKSTKRKSSSRRRRRKAH